MSTKYDINQNYENKNTNSVNQYDNITYYSILYDRRCQGGINILKYSITYYIGDVRVVLTF